MDGIAAQGARVSVHPGAVASGPCSRQGYIPGRADPRCGGEPRSVRAGAAPREPHAPRSRSAQADRLSPRSVTRTLREFSARSRHGGHARGRDRQLTTLRVHRARVTMLAAGRKNELLTGCSLLSCCQRVTGELPDASCRACGAGTGCPGRMRKRTSAPPPMACAFPSGTVPGRASRGHRGNDRGGDGLAFLGIPLGGARARSGSLT